MPIPGDKFGSRLWLLAREKITDKTLGRVREYAAEALQWMVDDGVAASVVVDVRQIGAFGVGLVVTIMRASTGQVVAVQFSDIWSALGA